MTKRRQNATEALRSAQIRIAAASRHLDGEVGKNRDLFYYEVNKVWHAVDALIGKLRSKRPAVTKP